ncbi:DUF1801 domain-containing protein [Aureivirga marina]|uniref:DUF1801 domain-containing protein n=1 Tax=Aureivirga marina TaxID=1182451 RepID=UPI0018CAD6EA|nr:DUF1801 domain-containing protein [Aureivirga marina]
MKIEANSPDEYLEKIPKDRREAMEKLRAVILENLPEKFEEAMSYGMIGYVVPHTVYPDGYHCDTSLPLPFMNIALQKNFIALYHSGIYAKPKLLKWFQEEYPKHCTNKLDMGKSCIRFKNIKKIPYDLIAELVRKMTADEWISIYEENVKNR